jgi:hypothetical protein
MVRQVIAHGGVGDRCRCGAVSLWLDHGPSPQERVLTVAVKVLTEAPLLSRIWAKFSNCYLRIFGEQVLPAVV